MNKLFLPVSFTHQYGHGFRDRGGRKSGSWKVERNFSMNKSSNRRERARKIKAMVSNTFVVFEL